MNAKQEDSRGGEAPARSAAKASGEAAAARAGARQRVESRRRRYMMMPLRAGLGEDDAREYLRALDGVDVIRSLAAGPGPGAGVVVVVEMHPQRAEALQRSEKATWLIEADHPLLAAAGAPWPFPRPGASMALGADLTATILVMGEGDEPVDRAAVQLLGRQGMAQATTGADGKAVLTLHGEPAETVAALVVTPRAGYWGLRIDRPRLRSDTVNAVPLKRLDLTETGWGGHVVRFDRLPTAYGGAGVKVALIDSGVATAHKQLEGIGQGFDCTGGKERSWAEDPTGHGTACAGIIAARRSEVVAMRGYAGDAELHVCRLPLAAHCSDLVAALDYCRSTGIDVACLGYGGHHGSVIVEQRIIAAKQNGMALIAAAGSSGGAVQFPACSPHVLAVGAVGQAGVFPQDSPAAAYVAAPDTADGPFTPAFSSSGPEVDVAAPGVAILSCQAPDGYAAWDGTSIATSHVAALAALVLGHHADFQSGYARRDATRVERLFQILKETARSFGDPARTGNGLVDAPCALGLEQPLGPTRRMERGSGEMPGLAQLRQAMRLAGLAGSDGAEAGEPPRGPASIGLAPLSAEAPPVAPAMPIEASLKELRSAMMLAGI